MHSTDKREISNPTRDYARAAERRTRRCVRKKAASLLRCRLFIRPKSEEAFRGAFVRARLFSLFFPLRESDQSRGNQTRRFLSFASASQVTGGHPSCRDRGASFGNSSHPPEEEATKNRQARGRRTLALEILSRTSKNILPTLSLIVIRIFTRFSRCLSRAAHF